MKVLKLSTKPVEITAEQTAEDRAAINILKQNWDQDSRRLREWQRAARPAPPS